MAQGDNVEENICLYFLHREGVFPCMYVNSANQEKCFTRRKIVHVVEIINIEC